MILSSADWNAAVAWAAFPLPVPVSGTGGLPLGTGSAMLIFKCG